MIHARIKHFFILAFVVIAIAGTAISAIAAPGTYKSDLDVAYIQRTPRYERYNVGYSYWVNYNDPNCGQPYLDYWEQQKQRWPKMDDVVTFTAVIKNQGKITSPAVTYKWYMDGVEVASGTLPQIAVGAQTSVTYNWTWDSEQNTHYIKFVADPQNVVNEEIESNNSREDATNALSFRFHVWKSLYEWFHTNARTYAPQVGSFDDWMQQQLTNMNRMFKEAVYPTSPNGILEHVRVDEIVVEDDATPDPEPCCVHAPGDWEWDGRWGFTNAEYLTPNNYFLANDEQKGYLKTFSPVLLHELSHQCGMIDLYQFNIELDNSNYIQPNIGHTNSRENCLMNRCVPYYSDHTAYAFNSNLHKRRGYFGEFLYDLPQTCRIRLVDAYFNPIPNATINFIQDIGRKVYYNNGMSFTGTTDAAGYYTLPNRSCFGTPTTATGHVPHDNPWGLINVVGANGLFFCEITVNGQTDYQYIELLPFNMAFAAGQKDTYTYDLQTNLVVGGRPTNNDLYGVKMVSANEGYAAGANGTILQWNGSTWTTAPNINTSYSFKSVDAVSGFACAVGDNGNIALGSNGVWSTSNVGSPTPLSACAVLSNNTIVAGGTGSVYRTTNGGQSWITSQVGYSKITSIRFFDATRGILTTAEPKIYYTTNAGATWTAATGTFEVRTLTDCTVAGANDAMACNDNGRVYRSTDAGKTWADMVDFGWPIPWNGIDIKDGGNGWAVGRYHEFYDTTEVKRFDNFRWTTHTLNTYGNYDTYYDVSAVNSDEAWAVGKNGLIIHLLADRPGYYPMGDVAQMLSQPDGKSVSVNSATVTASFPGAVYVESKDRYAGLKVLTNQSPTPGDKVQVKGILSTEGLERVIRFGDIVRIGTDDVRPVGITGKTVTGDLNSPGLKTTPLLVRVSGTVTATGGDWFTVDDGSGRLDSSGNKGIRVKLSGVDLPSKDTHVSVTGISSFESVSGKTYPLIRARNSNDIRQF